MKKTVEVAAAIIVDGGKFLICQRPPRKARGLLWEFPGGNREAGETLRDAAVREIREELGAVIEPLEVLETTSHEYPDLCVNLTLFKSVIRSGEIALFDSKINKSS
ncbi:MAG: (deoxy)nucleoside triphosphate pyrophosphohydrolase [Clostridia bacterium]|nr:(deoxy)nucleoside triphosphate pyrophosphohydrolase [Clostridia bacterium]